MIKLRIILAGSAVALFSQFAAAQSSTCPGAIVVPASEAPSDPKDPRYIDQSRLSYSNDPLIKRRVEASGGKVCVVPAPGR